MVMHITPSELPTRQEDFSLISFLHLASYIPCRFLQFVFGIFLTFVLYLNTLFDARNIQHVSHILQILWQNYGVSLVLEMAKAS